MENVLVTKKLLFDQLKQADIRRDDTVLIHSSMKAFGYYEGGMEKLIDALKEYLSDGLLLIPTHTWATVNKNRPVFDVINALPCTGLLPRTAVQAAAKGKGVRSFHPTHSVVAFGKEAKKFVAGEETISTPTPLNGCYGKLIEKNAAILLVGVNNTSNTFFHCLEEIAGVPCRISEKTVDFFDYDERTDVATPHPMPTIGCPYDKDVSKHFSELDDILTAAGAQKTCVIGNAPTILVRAGDASKVLLPIMRSAAENGEDYLLPAAYKRYKRSLKYRLKKLFRL